MKKFLTSLSIVAFCLLSFSSFAQLETPQPSTSATLIQKVGLAEIKIEYSRPSMKGRKIFGGDVVPLGDVWRLGANQPTKMTISDSITVKGKGGHAAMVKEYNSPLLIASAILSGKFRCKLPST